MTHFLPTFDDSDEEMLNACLVVEKKMDDSKSMSTGQCDTSFPAVSEGKQADMEKQREAEPAASG